MPKFDISIVKICQTTEEYQVTAQNQREAEKLAVKAAKKQEWKPGKPEIILDLVLEQKSDGE
ncbi:MAG: hypothetical protein DRN81_01205 [Thermoproteota archaeon]|nr:MAG: hypothetical protein DRN81_01205 [Candidatus Korarchaeota archaeon]